ncbi:hypothetical protein CE91St58_65390 [Lachnospiraceae bacterium]|nr:hypothetical protein CE91St58_65390 [Lachnospiraceae bacterium]
MQALTGVPAQGTQARREGIRTGKANRQDKDSKHRAGGNCNIITENTKDSLDSSRKQPEKERCL